MFSVWTWGHRAKVSGRSYADVVRCAAVAALGAGAEVVRLVARLAGPGCVVPESVVSGARVFPRVGAPRIPRAAEVLVCSCSPSLGALTVAAATFRYESLDHGGLQDAAGALIVLVRRAVVVESRAPPGRPRMCIPPCDGQIREGLK